MIFGIEHLPLFSRKKMKIAILLNHSFLLITTSTTLLASSAPIFIAALAPCIFALLMSFSIFTAWFTILSHFKTYLWLVLQSLNILIEFRYVILTWNRCCRLVFLQLVVLIYQVLVIGKQILVSQIGLFFVSCGLCGIDSWGLWFVLINDFDIFFHILLFLLYFCHL